MQIASPLLDFLTPCFVPGCFPACEGVFILVTEPAQEEVVEATITPQEGTTTGDNIANPDHSEKLDELAKQEPENQESENQEPQKQEETQETSS